MSGSFGALGVLRANAQDELTYVSWSAGTWSSAAPVGTAGWTLGTPALASATSAYLAFIGTDFKFYSTTYATSSWTTFAPVTVGANPSFGPAAPALAARASERCLVFEGSDGDLYSQSWTSGGFQAAYGHGLSTHVLGGVTPAIVARDGSNSWVVVYAQMGGALMWTQGNQTAWSAPAAVASGASSTSPVALLALQSWDPVATSITRIVTLFAPSQVSETSTQSVLALPPPVPTRVMRFCCRSNSFAESSKRTVVFGSWLVCRRDSNCVPSA